MISAEQLHILQHALGIDRYGQGNPFRNHFVTGTGSLDWPQCNELVQRRLMSVRRNHPLSGGDDCFWVTDAGKQYVAKFSPKRPGATRNRSRKARNQRYLEYGDGFKSFLEYCCWDSDPARTWNGGVA